MLFVFKNIYVFSVIIVVKVFSSDIRMLFVSKNIYVFFVIIVVKVLYMIDKYMIDPWLLEILFSLYIISIESVIYVVMNRIKWTQSIESKLVTLSTPSDFYPYFFLRGSFTSSTLILSHTCCSHFTLFFFLFQLFSLFFVILLQNPYAISKRL